MENSTKKLSSSVQIYALGGLGEVGKNMYCIENDNSLRALTNMSPKTLPYNIAEGIVYIANGRIFEGLFKMTKKIVAPSLPKENVNIKNK